MVRLTPNFDGSNECAPPPRVKTYRQHDCNMTHGSVKLFCQCALRGARVDGAGQFALIYWCFPREVRLFQTFDEATAALQAERYCGASCRGWHEVVFIDLAGQYQFERERDGQQAYQENIPKEYRKELREEKLW